MLPGLQPYPFLVLALSDLAKGELTNHRRVSWSVGIWANWREFSQMPDLYGLPAWLAQEFITINEEARRMGIGKP